MLAIMRPRSISSLFRDQMRLDPPSTLQWCTVPRRLGDVVLIDAYAAQQLDGGQTWLMLANMRHVTRVLLYVAHWQ